MTHIFDPALPPATVTLDGAGGPGHITITAPDSSCVWNDFLCELRCANDPFAAASVQSRAQIAPATILAPGQGPGDANWPPIYIPDYLSVIDAGWKLQARIRFHLSFAVPGDHFELHSNILGASVLTVSGFTPGVVVYDSGFLDVNADCTTMAGTGSLLLDIHQIYNSLSVIIDPVLSHGVIDYTFTPFGVAAPFNPYQAFTVIFTDPFSPIPKLSAFLPTDSCGNISITWNDLAIAISAQTPLIATGTAGLAQKDSGLLEGAICSAATKQPVTAGGLIG